MSMQIQAQLYIVETEIGWYNGNDQLSNAIIIQLPDGTTNIIEISNPEINASSMDGYIAIPPGSEDFSQDYQYSYLWKRLNDELNAIMSQGYEIVHILDQNPGGFNWDNKIYFLSVP